MRRKLVLLFCTTIASQASQAIIIIPIPNLGFPPAVSKIRDALEKSSETKALATVGEDKTFGTRYWVWGTTSGQMTQAEADSDAMRKCENQLEKTKSQTVGAQPLYDFGNKHCELYKFQNVTVRLPPPALPISAPELPKTGNVQAPEEPIAVVSQPMAPPASPALTEPAGKAFPQATVNAAEPTPMPSRNTMPMPQRAAPDIVQKMRDLEALLKQNLITKPEYDAKKKQLLDNL